MANPDNNPLTQDNLVEINSALAAISVAEKQAELAKRAGIDVTAEAASLADNKTKLTRLKQVYFPGQ